MKNILLIIVMLITISMNGQIMDCSELFISEYVEGSGNNKALEIYNPTSATIDLSEYIVIRYSNGATSASTSNAVQLVGSILSNDVHVGVISKLNAGGTGQDVPVDLVLQAAADEFYCQDYNVSNAWYWNGNDAVVLAKGSINDITNAIIVDVFGRVGEDPSSGAWTADTLSGFTQGAWWTMNHTLIRKSNVLLGDTDPIDLFNPSAEWDSIPEDSWDNLGMHECDCSNASSIGDIQNFSYKIYPNPVKQGNKVSIATNKNIKNIVVTNVLGGQVKSYNSINTSRLASGAYIIHVEFSNGSYAKEKLIVRD